jgi:hypothetical protein
VNLKIVDEILHIFPFNFYVLIRRGLAIIYTLLTKTYDLRVLTTEKMPNCDGSKPANNSLPTYFGFRQHG